MDSPPTPAPDDHGGLAPGDVIAGKFRLERLIGRGGMGSVWAARHLQLDMPLAVKFIETDQGPGFDMPDARARFEREARAAGQIRSPHVVQMIDHGIDRSSGRDRPYIAMELLEGEDLGERLRREGRIPVAATARIVSQAAKALRRAHEAGIIHRDLKPENVFLARFDDDEVVKLLDFGVAKMRRAGVLEEQLATQTGIVFGSPSYMSPEQARGRPIDHRSDLWSLAVILFRAVTGVKPFQATSIADLVIKLCIDPLPVATHVAPDLSPEVDRFFIRAFAREPDQRFATAVEMAAAFEAAAAATPTSPAASPEPPAEDRSPEPIGAPPPAVPGSGSHIAFAPGTLTPPPAQRPSSSTTEEPTTALAYGGMPESVSVPSGGWRIGPPVAMGETVEPPPPPSPSGASPTAAEKVGPRPAPRAPAPRSTPERGPLVLVTSLGGGLIVAILLAVVARQGPRAASAPPGPSAQSVTMGETPKPPVTMEETQPAVSAIPVTPPPEPPPSAVPEATATPSASATAEPAPEASANGATSAEPAVPETSGSAPSAPVPHQGWRSGKKKKPNFGY